jgi:hypothetical protein
MHKLIALAAASLFVANAALAAPPPACEERALSKEGKPLHGAAKEAFMKKCLREGPPPGAGPGTQQNKMKHCNAEAKDKKGEERKAFMKSCLSN